MVPVINKIDQTILFYVQHAFHTQLLDKLMMAVTFLGDRGAVWIAISVILIIRKKTRVVGILTLTALVLSTVMAEYLLKHLFQRPRPYVDFPSIEVLIKKLLSSSFPSGHTASSFACAYVLGKNFRKLAVLFWGLAGMIAFSRLYLFMHYPSDILAGAIVGILCAAAVVRIYDYARQS